MEKKKIIYIIIAVIAVILLVHWCGGSSSPVGTYRADLTRHQTGSITTIVLKSDGSATMTQDGHETEYTYWGYDDGGNVYINWKYSRGIGYWMMKFGVSHLLSLSHKIKTGMNN